MEWTEVESGMMPDIPSLFCGSFVSGIIKGALSPILGLLQKAKRHIAPPPPPQKKCFKLLDHISKTEIKNVWLQTGRIEMDCNLKILD